MDESLHNNEEQIQRYVDGEMDESSLEAFEEELAKSPQLQTRVETLRIAIEGFRQQALRDKVASIHSVMVSEMEGTVKTAKVVPFRRIVRYSLSVAAVIFFIFIGIGGYYYMQLNPAKVYNENFVDYTVAGTRGSTGKTSVVEDLYKQSKYAEVTRDATSSVNSKDSLLVALSWLKINQPAPSIEWLSPLTKTAGSVQQDAEYYLSLAFVKNHSYDKALALMKKINNDPSHIYHKQVNKSLIRQVTLLSWKE
jgi:hypothetical protein